MPSANALKILILAHDLSDPAIHKRVAMLRAGGALLTVAGFRRTPEPVGLVDGCRAIDFGQTFNAGFAQRIISVLRIIAGLNRHRALFADADVIIARNLEMLAIGVRGRSLCRPPPVLVYECLDIHRLLLGEGLSGMALRRLEGWLSRRASALFTSSPAFISRYFEKRSRVRLPIRLIENKVLDTRTGSGEAALSPRKPGPPWIIGWFGAIRCRTSLKVLSELVRQSGGTIEVVIRGRPSFDQFEDFNKLVTGTPGLSFLGPYKNPDDLAAIYRNVHFSWAIDMFEQGLNSSWLLPNRIYEGGLYDCVPIAIKSVETGAFIKKLGIGVAIKDPLVYNLLEFFRNLTPEGYRALEQASAAVPRSVWVCSRDDCRALVQYLAGLRDARPAHG